MSLGKRQRSKVMTSKTTKKAPVKKSTVKKPAKKGGKCKK